jgi:hypothetical protein
MVRHVGRFASSALALALIVTPALADDSKDAWAALSKGGHVALIRHGNAPPGYGGDPPGFRIDDCATQRNLDDVGREQARGLARPSAGMASAWTGPWPHRCAAAWTRPA